MTTGRSNPKRSISKLILLLLLTFSLAACQAAAVPTAAPEPTTETTATTVAPTPTVAATATLPPTPPATATLPTGTAGYPWWNDTVFYEIFVRSFYDSSGDGIGDLNGLIERLDYLQDLGVTGLWLMPIAESPSYHGYDVTDYYRVNPEYGSNDDFKRLMAEAHARGIRVIVDLVLNHTSRQHPWFREALNPDSDKRDWYIWADEHPGWRGPWSQPVWHLTHSGYFYGVFWDGMPDLNFENPEVTEAMLEVTRFWLEEMGVDGFRLDAIKHLIEDGRIQENTPATMAWFDMYHDFVKSINPDALLVGEVWSPTEEILPYIGRGVDIAFEFELAEAIVDSVNQGRRTNVSSFQYHVVDSYPPHQYATFLTNHDQNRVLSQLGADEDKAKVAATLYLASPGVPFIYYGEEIGMRGIKPDENLRLPMQWSAEPGGGFTTGNPWRPLHRRYQQDNVALQDQDPDSLLNHYRALIALRNDHAALRVGEWLRVNSPDRELYGFLRYDEDAIILVLVNLASAAVSDYRLDLPAGPLGTGNQATLLFGEGTPQPPAVNDEGGFSAYQPLPQLPAYSSFLIRLEENTN
jgi:alpha-amylase